ncbi:MAG: PstS family phosphate ABC transporter substrate-binding protein [bacterium]
MKRLTTLAAAALLAAGTIQAGEVMVKGSDTMLNLTQRLAEAFSKARPDVTVSITGGGSGVGINAITNGECDIANASRDIKSKEISTARANGVSPVEIVIGIDGLSVIVSEKSPVEKLTPEQIGAIYRGEIKNWSEVGGPAKKITLYGRQPSSGTFVFFREAVVKGEYATAMRQMNGNAQIVEAVKSDETGVGYVGVGYLREATGVKAVTVRNSTGEYVSPLDEDKVNAGLYPLTRPLFQYTSGRPKGNAGEFIRFELGPEGQAIVAQEGFFPITSDYRAANEAALGR